VQTSARNDRCLHGPTRYCGPGTLSRLEIERAFVWQDGGEADARGHRHSQGFYSAVKIELTDYYRSLAALENQIGEGSDLTLHRLLAWVKGPLEKLQILNILVVCIIRLTPIPILVLCGCSPWVFICLVQDNIKGKHGGEMASAVYKLVYHGSKIWRSVALSVLNQTAKPIIAMIRAWMLEVHTGHTLAPLFTRL
jgi:hypothetical protein